MPSSPVLAYYLYKSLCFPSLLSPVGSPGSSRHASIFTSFPAASPHFASAVSRSVAWTWSSVWTTTFFSGTLVSMAVTPLRKRRGEMEGGRERGRRRSDSSCMHIGKEVSSRPSTHCPATETLCIEGPRRRKKKAPIGKEEQKAGTRRHMQLEASRRTYPPSFQEFASRHWRNLDSRKQMTFVQCYGVRAR